MVNVWTEKRTEYGERITAAENAIILSSVRGYSITPEKLADFLAELCGDSNPDDEAVQAETDEPEEAEAPNPMNEEEVPDE